MWPLQKRRRSKDVVAMLGHELVDRLVATEEFLKQTWLNVGRYTYTPVESSASFVGETAVCMLSVHVFPAVRFPLPLGHSHDRYMYNGLEARCVARVCFHTHTVYPQGLLNMTKVNSLSIIWAKPKNTWEKKAMTGPTHHPHLIFPLWFVGARTRSIPLLGKKSPVNCFLKGIHGYSSST